MGFLRVQGTKDLIKDGEEETLAAVGDAEGLSDATEAETCAHDCIASPGPHAGRAATPAPNGTELGD